MFFARMTNSVYIFTVAREVDFAFQTSDRQRQNHFAEFVNGKSYGTAAVSKFRSPDTIEGVER